MQLLFLITTKFMPHFSFFFFIGVLFIYICWWSVHKSTWWFLPNRCPIYIYIETHTETGLSKKILVAAAACFDYHGLNNCSVADICFSSSVLPQYCYRIQGWEWKLYNSERQALHHSRSSRYL